MLTHDTEMLEAGERGNPISFHWDIIDKCQYKCTYCYATEFNKNDFFNHNRYHNVYKTVLYRLRQIKTDFEVDLLGGEPTLHPHLSDIIHALEDMEHCTRINLYTNFSAPVSFYVSFDKKDSKLNICFSYHAQYHKNILKKCLTLQKELKYSSVFIEVNLFPKLGYFDQLEELILSLKDNNIEFGVNLIRENEFWDNVVDKGFYERFGDYINDLHINPQSRPVRHLTPSGEEYLSENYIIKHGISYAGYLCEALMYKIEIDGSISNMCSNKKVPLRTGETFHNAIHCPLNTVCPCADMLYYYKKKDD